MTEQRLMASTGKGDSEQRVRLARDPRAARDARHFIERLLRCLHVADRAVENAMLVSSELVSNAYRHGNGSIELRLRVLHDRVRIEVVDEGRDQAPAVREQEPDETGGWGLRVVDQLSLQWGVFEGTTHVWADLALR